MSTDAWEQKLMAENKIECSKERLRTLLRTVNDRSLTVSEREVAKNQMVLQMVENFLPLILKLTGGGVGIDDHEDLEVSAFAYMKARASRVANEVESKNLPLVHVVSKWLNSWAVDKIRVSQGNTLKRGKGHRKVPVSETLLISDMHSGPEWEATSKEVRMQIDSAVRASISNLDELERAVVLSRFGLVSGEDLTMREVSDELGVPLNAAGNAWRSARRKLSKWLADFDQNTNLMRDQHARQ